MIEEFFLILQNPPTTDGRFKNTIREDQMLNFKQYVEDLDRRAFEITNEQFARLTLNYVEALKKKERAGKDFIQAIHKNNIAAFFNLCKEILGTKAPDL